MNELTGGQEMDRKKQQTSSQMQKHHTYSKVINKRLNKWTDDRTEGEREPRTEWVSDSKRNITTFSLSNNPFNTETKSEVREGSQELKNLIEMQNR